MKSRKLYVMLPLALGLAAVLLVLSSLGNVTWARQSADLSPAESRGHDATILARRLISIPFGIADSLPLAADGKVIQVSGHGECPAGAESFRLKVKVRQDGAPAPATGWTTGACPAGSTINWTAQAVAPGPNTFDSGSAEACGHVVIQTDKKGAVTGQWCKTVTLE